MDKIPKIIHYIWLGDKEMNGETLQYIKKWKEVLIDYEFMEWNEKNFNIDCMKYTREAYNMKKYAYVSDVIRLFALQKYGGIYLDTDVEIIKKFDSLLEYNSFLGFESDNWLSTAVIAAKKNEKWISEVLNIYEKLDFLDADGNPIYMTNVKIITNYFVDNYNLKKNGEEQELLTGIMIFPQIYFSPIRMDSGHLMESDKTICIHRFKGTWIPKKSLINKWLYRTFLNLFGKEKAEKVYDLIKKENKSQ